MSCSNCSEVVIEPGKHGLQYTLVPGTEGFTASTGEFYVIRRCMIPSPKKPIGGWNVVIYIQGQKISISGRTPVSVFTKVRDLFATNDVEHSEEDIWFNLNIQWVSNAVPKYQIIKLQDLLNKAIVNYV
jgi:hypothetical protein